MKEAQKHLSLSEWKARFDVSPTLGQDKEEAEVLPEGLAPDLLRSVASEITSTFTSIIDELPTPPINRGFPWGKNLKLENGREIRLEIYTDVFNGKLYRIFFEVKFEGASIGEFCLLKAGLGPEWGLSHRDIHPDLRGSKLGSAMLDSVEYFLKNEIKGETAKNSLSLETSQLSIICWLINRGYVGVSDLDKKKLQILEGYSKDGDGEYEIQITSHIDDSWLLIRKKGTPIFENFRVKMHKEFFCIDGDMDQMTRDTNKATTDVIK